MTTPTITPAGWYPDPSLRHQFRYWDGTGWSSLVSDRGVTTTDSELQPAASPGWASTIGPPAAAYAQAPTDGSPAAPAPALAAPAPARPGRQSWVLPVVAVVALLAVLAVTGGLVIWRTVTSVPSAGEVYAQVQKSAAAAKSVHVKGSFTADGKKMQIDLAGDRVGKSSRAIVNDGTGEVEILTVNGNYYIKADAAFWTKNGSSVIAELAADKYVKVPAGSASALGNLTVGALLPQILDPDMSKAEKLTTNVEKTQVGGVPAYLITDRIGSDGSKMYVSADGTARLLRLEGPKDEGSLDFTEWDAVAPMTEPPASQIVTIPGL